MSYHESENLRTLGRRVCQGKCLCGKPMTGKALLPIGNVYAGLTEVKDWQPVCEYHAQKAKKLGYEVV